MPRQLAAHRALADAQQFRGGELVTARLGERAL
jgi:hypothetical protein